MSRPEHSPAEPERVALGELDRAVTRMLEQLTELRSRVQVAEQKSVELEEVVRRFTGNPEETGRLLSRLEQIQSENLDLRERLHAGREGIDRVLARIRFLENQR